MAELPLWSVENLYLGIGRQILFDHASLAIAENERVALVGRNGSGKSTLLKIIAGLEQPGQGEISVRNHARIAYMPQDVDFATDRNIEHVVREGLAFFEQQLERYDSVSQNSPEHAEIEHFLSYHNAWHLENKLSTMLHKLDLNDLNVPFASLSGGEKRRVMLARAIIAEPDLLLLDEPTNHLDVATVGWIEDFLSSYRGACFFVTHDRYFLDRIATRIVELERGKFFSCIGSYGDFLEAKADAEYAEDVEASKREKFLRREIEWVRRSPKARLRRNLGRMRRFEELSDIQAPERTGNMDLVIPEPERLGNKVVDLEHLDLAFGERSILRDFNFEFTAKHKVGVIGPNGIGKSTLLKLITGELQPDHGIVKIADTVHFNYVDQTRLKLNGEATVCEEVAGESDTINLGKESISVWGYLKRFLFEDERINTKVKYLSGGEKARLLLAKILKNGGNFLILDEPTNDLDLPTLRVLEEALANYASSLIVVSHDRYFLNRVCNHIIAFEPGETEKEAANVVVSIGDFDYYWSKKRERDAQKAEARAAQTAAAAAKKAAGDTAAKAAGANGTPRKLSFLERKELANMESEIATAEAALSAIEAQFSEPDFFVRNAKEMPKFEAELAAAKERVDALYQRWEYLESLN